MTINTQCFTNILNLFLGFLSTIIVGNLHIKQVWAETINSNSYDESVSIIYLRKDCSTIEPIAKYSVKNGETEGVLYTTVCFSGNSLPNALVDEFKYTFIDTGGTNSDRCYGTVDISTPSAIRYKWQFLGAIPGYTCTKTKQTILRYYPKGY